MVRVTIRFVPSHTESALEIVATECERTSDERDAFVKFAGQIAAFENTSPSGSHTHKSPTAHTLLQTESGSDPTLARVRDAYRESVMSVPHYDEEYDESFREHLTAEFGPEVATALMSANQFTRTLQDRLITEAQAAVAGRESFLTALQDETSALQTVDERLTHLGTELSDLLDTRSVESWSNDQLSHAHKRLRASKRECEDLATDRQATLHKRRMPSIQRIDPVFAEYLYQPLSVTYPVLADITSLTETLHAIESDVEQALEPL